MEYIDIVDKNGKPTGQTASRDEVHSKGLKHRHIHVWITNSTGEILLQKRAENKKIFPNLWAMAIEGHVSAGESLDETIIKEAMEELFIKLTADELNFLFEYSGRMDFGPEKIENYVNSVFIVHKNIPIDQIEIDKSEVADVKWMPWRKYKKELETENPAYRPYKQEFLKLFEYLEKEQS